MRKLIMNEDEWLKQATVKQKIRNTRFNIVRFYTALILLDIIIWIIPILAIKDLMKPNILVISNPMVVEAAVEDTQEEAQVEHVAQIVQTDVQASSIGDKIKKEFPENYGTMIQIARAESRLNPNAVNINRNGTKDCGIFQINEIHGYDCEWLKNVDNNLKVAKEVYEKQGYQAWAVYNYAKKYKLPI